MFALSTPTISLPRLFADAIRSLTVVPAEIGVVATESRESLIHRPSASISKPPILLSLLLTAGARQTPASLPKIKRVRPVVSRCAFATPANTIVEKSTLNKSPNFIFKPPIYCDGSMPSRYECVCNREKLSSAANDSSFLFSVLNLCRRKTRPVEPPNVPEHEPQELTEILRRWSDGDAEALEQLTPTVYAELHRIAKRYMGRERKGHTLQTTALVNEAYVRLIDWKNAKWQNRAHFFGVSAQLMRRILVDFARKRPGKKDAPVYQVSLDEAFVVTDEKDADLVAVDEALTELAKFDERKARIVELKFFGGLSVEEIAEVIGVSGVTVMREWQKAKAWLYVQLNRT